MFSNSGPMVNNVLACMTDRIVCATFSADPSAMNEDDEEAKDVKSVSSGSSSTSPKHSSKTSRMVCNAAVLDQPGSLSSATVLAPVSSLALAAAPLLTSNFAFDTRGVTVLRNYSAPNSRRSSEQPDLTTSISAQLSLVGDHTNSGALLYHTDSSSRTISVHSLCHLPADQGHQTTSCSPMIANHRKDRRQSETSASSASGACGHKTNQQHHHDVHGHHLSRYPLSPKAKHKPTEINSSVCVENPEEIELPAAVVPSQYEVDSSVRSAQITPDSTPGRSLSSSRSRINTDDRERFTEEVTV